MKKVLAFILTTSIVTNSAIISSNFTIPSNNLYKSGHIDQSLANQYAKETSIIPKSLLIGKQHAFTTDTLLKSLNSKLSNPEINFTIPQKNSVNDFIENVTTKRLDLSSINKINENFQAEGANQKGIDDAFKKINEYSTYKSYSEQAQSKLNNITLSNKQISDAIDAVLRSAKTKFPDIVKYLPYTKFQKLLPLALNELLNNWDQQKDYGSTPIEAMKKYIASDKGNIAQAKNPGKGSEWYYVLTRAQKNNWDWNHFYEYMAGANLNYMFKILTNGKYLGDLITDNISILHKGFDVDNFIKQISAAVGKLTNTPEAWPYLIKGIVPVLKEKILDMSDPTLGITSLSWNNKDLNGNNAKNIEVKLILQKLAHLLSPSGHQDLINLIASLLKGPFAEDIIVKPIGLYYTIPEIFDTFSWFIKPEDFAKKIVDAIDQAIEPLKIDQLLNNAIDFADKYLTKNPIIDLKDLLTCITNIFNDDFDRALDQIIDLVNNPDKSPYNAAGILEILGVQKNAAEFRANSPLYWIKASLQNSDSSISKLLAIFSTKDNTGIIDNMIKEQQKHLNDNYYKYFDIDNQNQFSITNVVASENNNVISLSYNLTDTVNNKSYSLVFISQDKAHKKFLLNRFQ